MNEKCFSIDHIGEGSIAGHICDGENDIFFDNANTSDFANDILLAVLTATGEYPASEHRETFWADLEPVQAKWSIFGSNSRIRVTVAEFDSERREQEKSVSVTLDRDVFLRDIADAFGGALRRFGLYGYRTEWGYEFPLSIYLRLKDVLDGTDSTALTREISAKENMGLATKGSDIEKEKSAF